MFVFMEDMTFSEMINSYYRCNCDRALISKRNKKSKNIFRFFSQRTPLESPIFPTATLAFKDHQLYHLNSFNNKEDRPLNSRPDQREESTK